MEITMLVEGAGCDNMSALTMLTPAVEGTAALLARCVTEVELVAYEDLGSEAIRRLVVEDFPSWSSTNCTAAACISKAANGGGGARHARTRACRAARLSGYDSRTWRATMPMVSMSG
jgi:tartrate dehydratase alpha subunit/fumarate hydratase class I-like protein